MDNEQEEKRYSKAFENQMYYASIEELETGRFLVTTVYKGGCGPENEKKEYSDIRRAVMRYNDYATTYKKLNKDGSPMYPDEKYPDAEIGKY